MASIDGGLEIIAIARRYAELVKCEIASPEIYLFGSQLAGTSDRDSDIDIAVIADSFSGDLVEDTVKLMALRRRVDTRIEPHPLRTDDPFASEVIKQGLRLA